MAQDRSLKSEDGLTALSNRFKYQNPMTHLNHC
jgi:hypothetical protein